MSWLDLTRRVTVVARVTMAAAMSACAVSHQDMQPPEAALLAFARALSDGKPEASYALMSRAYRDKVSFEAWQKALEENSAEAMEIGNALSHHQGPAEVQALLRGVDGHEVRLVREGE